MRFKNLLIYICGILLCSPFAISAQDSLPTPKNQIEAAVSPAPEDMQEGAKVLGYNTEGKLLTLRKGTNELICLADDPDQSNFHTACYHHGLEPFMKRGRDLKAKGLSRKKVDSLRRVEIKTGKLKLPRKPMALYSLTGPGDAFNYSTGEVKNARPLYVVYIPFATEETTGLSQKPASKGAPWIMEPGTPWAHIMVMTGREVSNKTDVETGN